MEPIFAPDSFSAAGYETFTSLFNIYQKVIILIFANVGLLLVFIILVILKIIINQKIVWFVR